MRSLKEWFLKDPFWFIVYSCLLFGIVSCTAHEFCTLWGVCPKKEICKEKK